jgi:hypothetical protein
MPLLSPTRLGGRLAREGVRRQLDANDAWQQQGGNQAAGHLERHECESFLASLQLLVAQRESFLTRLDLKERHAARIAAQSVLLASDPDTEPACASAGIVWGTAAATLKRGK